MSEREFQWNDTIQNDSTFEVLPEGDYDFVIKAFERGVSVSAPVRCMQYSPVKHRTRQSLASSRYTVLEPKLRGEV